MKYKLYIINNCTACQRVINSLNGHKEIVSVVNASQPGTDIPENLVIFPALFREGHLVAYGMDIPAAIQ